MVYDHNRDRNETAAQQKDTCETYRDAFRAFAKDHDVNFSELADFLRISRTTLYRWMEWPDCDLMDAIYCAIINCDVQKRCAYTL